LSLSFPAEDIVYCCCVVFTQAVWLLFIGDVTILARTLFKLQLRLIKKFAVFLLNIRVYSCQCAVTTHPPNNGRYPISNTPELIFWYFSDRAYQYIYLNINQLDALNFVMSLFHASTCFEHMCSSSGGQNCITQPLVSSHL